MSELSKALHSIVFGDKNTYDDWFLMPIDRPVIVPPELKYVSVDIAGADGELDLSEALTPFPVFENRKGTLKFRMLDNGLSEKSVLRRKQEIMNYLHGKRMKVVLEDDRGYYYLGRVEVDDFKFKGIKDWADITFRYNLEPYKYETTTTAEDWLWDPFNFETGVIRNYRNINVSGTTTVKVIGSRKPVTPIFTVNTQDVIVLYYNEVNYLLNSGRNTVAEIVLTEGEHVFKFSGEGTVTIEFRGGAL